MTRPALDHPDHVDGVRDTLRRKAFLRRLYLEFYAAYAECLSRCPPGGDAVELGSGGGFVQEVLPEVITTDVTAYPGVDRVVDARRMPFEAGRLRALFLLNTFHHVADTPSFLREAERCLAPGARVLILDQHPGWISSPVLRHLHHEGFDPGASRWEFESSGPLSGANGALAWIVFQRDRSRFEREFPLLRMERYETHTPLRYWLAGGLKRWSLSPGWAFPAATALDRLLVRIHPDLGSFSAVELVRLEG